MKNRIVYLLLSICGCFIFSSQVYAISKPAKVTIVVVDEQGQPLEGADVGVGFRQDTGWGTKSTARDTIVGADGKFTVSDRCNSVITYGASKVDYYNSYYKYIFQKLSNNGWEPWNPELKIVMRKIENPVSMYARSAKSSRKKIEIPVVGKDVGFDLVEYDWVPPYGKGKYPDFIFHLRSRISSERDYEYNVVLKFSDGNGIQKFEEDMGQGSIYKLPRYAPEHGYIKELQLFTRRLPGKQIERSRKEGVNYIFRIRAKVEDGKVVDAIYGKILRDIYVRPKADDKAKIEFTYYLNPDGTRNLEFAPSRNLFTDLTDLEKVGIK